MKGHMHLHTTASDGLIEPEDVIKSGQGFVAVTDHDTFDGIERFKVLENYGIEVIPGIELSARHMGKNIHMLIYYPEYKPEFIGMLKAFGQKRLNRARGIADKLRALGFSITEEDIAAQKGILSKGNVSNIVLSYPGNREKLGNEGIFSEHDFIKAYLNKGKPAALGLKGNEISELFKLVNGVKVLAHPGHNLGMGEYDHIVKDLKKNHGLWGIEVWTRRHTGEEIEYYGSLAQKLGLYATRSNDVHRRKQIEGNMDTKETLEAVKRASY
ncbi:MAG: PHP domain-containing protein [Candidatus Woesearchaeota archaeon]